MTVRLTWPGRDDAPIEPSGTIVASERIPDASVAPAGRVIEGDNLQAMRALLAEGLSVDLAYLDPPYASGTDYAHTTEGHAYGDRWSDRAAYLDMLWPRLRAVHALLAPHGTIWVQVDHRASGVVQCLLDELFGEARLRNVIAWRRAPPLGRQVQSRQFPRNVDFLFAYAKGEGARWNPIWGRAPFDRKSARYDEERKRWFTTAPRGDYTDESVARLDKEGRIHRTSSGKVYVKYFLDEEDGVLYKPRAVDGLWDDVAPLRHAKPSERTGYPTQKPEPLLARIIAATSNPGDRVLDPFAGSATTAIAAANAGRSFICIDQSPVALETTTARLRAANVPFSRERLAGPQGR